MFPQSVRFFAALIALSALLAAAPVQASPVLEVDGSRVTRADDPFVPGGLASDLGREPRTPRLTASGAGIVGKRGPKAVGASLRRARRKGAISRARLAAYRRIYSLARSRHRRLRGARRRELGSVIETVGSMALRRELTASRMPALFLILRRNAEFWPRSAFPANRGFVTFSGSELVFEYYRGSGLQLQPLLNFKKANLLHGACVKRTAPCEPDRLRRLLGEMVRTSASRGGFRAWEYYFEFGGGRPPWMSAMAQATGIQAFARASQLLRDEGLLRYAREGLPAFTTPAPTGILTRGPLGGTHYLQYSFAPRLYIINAFLQSVIGLYDYADITGDATARRLFERAEPEARGELLRNDTGDWSTYSFGGADSSREYHELLREFAASLCSRLRRDAYCDTARNFASYTTEPAKLILLGPDVATRGKPEAVRFSVSKLAAVQITIRRAGKVVFDRVATFRRGTGSFAFTPRANATFSVRLAAKELRTGDGLRTYDTGTIEAETP
ncbi:MAG: D-glucuronyl C5-epimerase family protein [Thermoleophilaceae bacterium]